MGDHSSSLSTLPQSPDHPTIHPDRAIRTQNASFQAVNKARQATLSAHVRLSLSHVPQSRRIWY
jgi:hypothetical protein